MRGSSTFCGVFILFVACGPRHAAPVRLPQLPELRSEHGAVSFTLTAALDKDRRPTFFWHGRNEAPLLRVNPGDHIRIRLISRLPKFCGLGMRSIVNLHFHGFSSSPNVPGDDVLHTIVRANNVVDYDVAVNPAQSPGLYWYHAHAHGLSSWEVGNGMSGAIIVNGIANNVPEVKGLREHVIMLRDRPNDPSVQSVKSELAQLPHQAAPTPDPHGNVPRYVHPVDNDDGPACKTDPQFTPTINGVAYARIGIRPGERELFRVVNASASRYFRLEVDGPMKLVAQDGIALADFPRGRAITANDLLIPPAGRAEFIVTGSTRSTKLSSPCFSSGLAGDPNPPVTFADFYDDRSDSEASRQRVESVPRSQRSSRYRLPIPKPAARRLVRLEENRDGYMINGKQYHPTDAPMFIARSGTVEEWTIENNTDENHVFHVHQTHFVVESTNGYPNPSPHWLDVADISPRGRGARFGEFFPTRVRILVDFRDPLIRGTFPFHCHIIDHEDGGMSAKIAVR